jgi:hypothetical protein
MNRYDHTFAATCPNDSRTIIYHLTIKTEDMVKVEDIEAACFFGTAYHEAIADRLIEKFGGRQTIRAMHQGVHIKTTRSAIAP